MKPTPQQILSALNKMIQSKTELKSEKIELGAIDDLEKADKEGRKLIEELAKEQGEVDNKYDDIKSLVSKYNTLNKNYRDSIKKGKSAFKELMDNINKVQKGIKELGITANDVPVLKSALRSSDVLRSRTNDAIDYPDIKL
jgi:predicted nuclease with TOPRIM domain